MSGSHLDCSPSLFFLVTLTHPLRPNSLIKLMCKTMSYVGAYKELYRNNYNCTVEKFNRREINVLWRLKKGCFRWETMEDLLQVLKDKDRNGSCGVVMCSCQCVVCVYGSVLLPEPGIPLNCFRSWGWGWEGKVMSYVGLQAPSFSLHERPHSSLLYISDVNSQPGVILPPWGNLAMIRDRFDYYNCWCYWHLVSRGQGC